MTRSILCGLLALVSVGALGVVPIACQSGGVGDPCTPEDEYNTQFPGFKLTEENIESRSFQCSTRICLVNHFQGRVSCPYGQADTEQYIKPCNGPGDTTTCGEGVDCVESQALAPECDCDASKPGDCDNKCGGVDGVVCDPQLKICTCTGSAAKVNGTDYYCVNADKNCTGKTCTRVLKAFVCHKPGSCQTADIKDEKNYGKQCCVPGTDTPITVPVCGQCDTKSHRNAADSVYCSCRCCPKCCNELTKEEKDAKTPCADDQCGSKCDPNFNYCSCPTGFTCSEIRKFVGLGDPQLAGSYCIKEETEYKGPTFCGELQGVTGEGCVGNPVSHISTDGGT